MRPTVILMILLAVQLPLQAQLDEISGFRVPDYDEEGNLKSQIFGDFAKMKPGNVVDITNLKIELYKDQAVDVMVTAPACTYDRNSGNASSSNSIKITGQNMVVTGRDFVYSVSEQRFEITKDVRVVLKDMKKDISGGTAE